MGRGWCRAEWGGRRRCAPARGQWRGEAPRWRRRPRGRAVGVVGRSASAARPPRPSRPRPRHRSGGGAPKELILPCSVDSSERKSHSTVPFGSTLRQPLGGGLTAAVSLISRAAQDTIPPSKGSGGDHTTRCQSFVETDTFNAASPLVQQALCSVEAGQRERKVPVRGGGTPPLATSLRQSSPTAVLPSLLANKTESMNKVETYHYSSSNIFESRQKACKTSTG